MKVTTAVIMAAGYGTRMLPVTASVPKVLLPILNRPVIDYVVEDCLAAGVTNIIFVINPGSRGLQDYYVGNPGLDAHLKRHGKEQALEMLARLRKQAKFTFLEQPPGNYGTAVPVKLALPHVPAQEAFLVSEGDSFSWHPDETSEVTQLVQLFEKSGADGAVMGAERPKEVIHKYGVFDLENRGEYEYLRRLVEKPAPGEEPSNVANISRYILTPRIAKYLADLKPNEPSGEYFITDAVTNAASELNFVIHRATGQWLDAGSTEGWLRANLTLAVSHPELAAVLDERPQNAHLS